jgi:hypothetical protein
MSTRRGWVFAAMAALSGGGCAVIAGYDFGKYSETGGTGGVGGQAASSTGSTSVSSSSGPTSSSSSGPTGSSSSTSASSNSGMAASSSSGSSGKTTSSSSTGSSSTSTGFSSSSSGTVEVVALESQLLGPEAIAVDTQNVYFTTNNAAPVSSTVGWVAKSGATSCTSLPAVTGAPAIVVGDSGSGAYAATWDSATAGTVYSVSSATVKVVGTVADSTLGVAAWGATVFFTTTGSKVWTIPSGGAPANFTSSPDIASGPIAADSLGVYWTTATGQMLAADLGGAKAITLCTLPDPMVYAVATDEFSVYWTDQAGGVYQASKTAAGTPTPLNTSGAGTPAYGIAVDPSNDGTVYFAQGAQVLRVTSPYGHPPNVIVTGLVNPRGVAFDGTSVYVAEKGTSNPASPDGRILMVPP